MKATAMWWIVGFVTLVIGVLLTASSVRLVGRIRAASNWPAAPPIGRISRTLSKAGAGAGPLLLGAGAWLLAAALLRPTRPTGWLLTVIVAGAALLAGGVAAGKLARSAELTALIRTPPAANWIPAQDQRPGSPAGHEQDGIPAPDGSTPAGTCTTPAGTSTTPAGTTAVTTGTPGLASAADPAVPPDGCPGWVYRDPDGDWYLAVAAGTAASEGQCLVRLSDFALVPAGTVEVPLDLAGSIQIAVFPVTEAHAGQPA